MSIHWVTRDDAPRVVKRMVIKTNVVLDVGPGLRPQSYFKPRIHLCVEPYLPYIERLTSLLYDDEFNRIIFLNGTWQNVFRLLPDKSVDSIFALDVIEHMEKEEGIAFLKDTERLARRQILIHTPLGFYPQSYDDNHNTDRYGMQGGYWQTHRSGWLPGDFGTDWELVCCERYHLVDENNYPLATPFGAIWAFRNFEARKRTVLRPTRLRLLAWKYIPHSVRAGLKSVFRQR